MNNSNETTMYRSSQNAPVTSSGDYLDKIQTVWEVLLVIGFIIFIIWIWSMISMIMLNMRFKYFYEDYRRNQLDNHSDDSQEPAGRREVVVEPLSEEPVDKSVKGWFDTHRGMAIFLAISLSVMAIVIIVSATYSA